MVRISEPSLFVFYHVKIHHSRLLIDYDDQDIYTNTNEKLWRSLKTFDPTNININNVEIWLNKFKGSYKPIIWSRKIIGNLL